MTVFNKFWKCYFCMFRCFLKVSVAACIPIQRFFVLFQRLSIYLQESDLAIQTFLSCLVNLMRFFLGHFYSELFSSLVEVPVELHRLVVNLTEHCFFPQDAKRTNGASSWVALNLQAKKMIREATCCALEKALILDDLLPSTDALNILIVNETRRSTFQRISEDIFGWQFFLFLMSAIENSHQIRWRIREKLWRRMRLYCKSRNIVQISRWLGLGWWLIFQDVRIAFLGFYFRVIGGLREGKHRVHVSLHPSWHVVVQRCHRWIRKQKIIDFLRRRDLCFLVNLDILPVIAWAKRCLSIHLQQLKVELFHLLWTIKRRCDFLYLLLSDVNLLALPVLRVLVPHADEELMHLLGEVRPE